MSAGSPPPRADAREDDAALARTVRNLVIAWFALIVLMLASFGSAYLSLGAGNFIAGIGIATIKVAIVVWVYMQLRRASAMVRIAAATGLVMLVLLSALSGVDYATRVVDPAPFQTPRQLPPLIDAPARVPPPASS